MTAYFHDIKFVLSVALAGELVVWYIYFYRQGKKRKDEE